MLSFFLYLTLTLFIIVCVFLILLILIQKGRGGGLSSAFGGASGNTAFGSKTGDVLTWATSIIFGIFLILAVSLNLLANARYNKAPAARSAPAPATPAPTPTPTTPSPTTQSNENSVPIPEDILKTLPRAESPSAPVPTSSTAPAK